MEDNQFFLTAPQTPITDRIGEVVELTYLYEGRDKATIIELIGRNAFGVPLYGCHLEGYEYNGQPITVDFAANEFKGELGEAYQEQHDKRLKMLEDLLEES